MGLVKNNLRYLLESFSKEDISKLKNGLLDDSNLTNIFINKAHESGSLELVQNIKSTETHVIKKIVKGLIQDA